MRQEINQCNIPKYMEDILSNNFCPNFIDMCMVREDDEYIFNYRSGRYKKLDVSVLDTYLKLVLLKTLILLNERNENWLIKAENYLIEPELVYCINNCVEDGSVRLLFYPDLRKVAFNTKIILFADKIKNRMDKNEIELIDKFKSIAESEDWNRIKIFLDKNIVRLQTGWN